MDDLKNELSDSGMKESNEEPAGGKGIPAVGIILSAVIIAVIAYFYLTPKGNDSDEWMKKAGAFISQKQFQEAINAYSLAIEKNPKNATAYLGRGTAYGELGKHDDALKDMNRAIEISPSAEAYVNRGIALAKTGNNEGAIKDFNKAIESNPSLAYAYSARGLSHFIMGNIDNSINDYKKAVELNPNDKLVYSMLGASYLKNKNIAESVKNLEKALEITPNDSLIMYNLACAYSVDGKVEKACEYLKASVDNGYKEFNNIKTDNDMANVREHKCYKDLMANK